MSNVPQVLVLHEKNIGDRNQAETLARLMGWPYRLIKAPPARRGQLPDTGEPRPDIIIAVDARSTEMALELKRRSPKPVKVIKIGKAYLQKSRSLFGLKKRTVNDDVDLNIAYDQYITVPSPKIVQLPVPLSPIDPAECDAAKAAFPHLGALPRPRIAVLVGGGQRYFEWTPAVAARVGRDINAAVETSGGSLMITTSYKTGADCAEALLAEIKVPHDAYRWNDGKDPPNPLKAYLGYADKTIVTINTIAMVADALNTGKPVSIYPLQPKTFAGLKNFVERFYSVSHRTGVIRKLVNAGEVTWFGEPDKQPKRDYRALYTAAVEAARKLGAGEQTAKR